MVDHTPEPFFAPAWDAGDLDVAFGSPSRQKRWTVALRGLLALPQLIVVAVLGVVATFLAIIGWFVALVLGRLPKWIAKFEIRWIAYSVRVSAYLYMLIDDYPPFAWSDPGYPIAVKIGPSRVSRLKVLFRWLLLIPTNIVAGIVGGGLATLSPVLWVITLSLGRMPKPLFGAAAAVLRYQARYYAYANMVTDAYPGRLFGDTPLALAPEGVGREFRLPLSVGAKRLVVLIIILGIAFDIGDIVLQVAPRRSQTNSALVAAEARFESASARFISSVGGCGTGPNRVRCLEPHDRAWSRAFDRFASNLSSVSFSPSQLGTAAALAGGARTVAQALLDVSRTKTAASYDRSWNKVQRSIRSFEKDSNRLLGHPL